MGRPINKFPTSEKTNFQRLVSLKLKEKEKDWRDLQELCAYSESYFRNIQNGTKDAPLNFVFATAKMLKVHPKVLIGSDKFTLSKQSVARSLIPELCQKHGIELSNLINIYKMKSSTAQRALTGAPVNYSTLMAFYMKVFRSRGYKSVLDLIEFS